MQNSSVAIVDDEADVIRTYELLFKKYQMSMAFSALMGREAIEKFRAADPRPGVIIIDYRLPDIDGLEIMKEIQAIEPRTKIVVISGDESVKQEALNRGALVFLKKPTPIKVIAETLDSLINQP